MDTGHIATRGYKAGAVKFVALRGFVPNPATIVNACLATRGFGAATAHKLSLRGFLANPEDEPMSGGCIFGGQVLTGYLEYLR